MEDCIFCKIIKGEIPCLKIYEDRDFLAFLDVKPINPGHTLLVPKKHDDYLFDLTDIHYASVLLKAKDLAKLLKDKLNPKRVGLVVEGFGVAHVHVHLIPINQANELNPERAKLATMEELEAIAKKLS